MTRRSITFVLLLLAACKSPAPLPERASATASAAAPSAPRWFPDSRTYEHGPALAARAESISFCADGRYVTQVPYTVGPCTPPCPADAPKRGGLVCCRDGERGTYELESTPGGALQTIHLTPDGGAPHDVPVTSDGRVYDRTPQGGARFCGQ